MLTIAIRQQKLTLTNVYAPNVQTKRTYHDIMGWLAGATTTIHLIGGNFNNVMDVEEDRRMIAGVSLQQNSTRHRTNIETLLTNMAAAFQVSVVWRLHHLVERVQILLAST